MEKNKSTKKKFSKKQLKKVQGGMIPTNRCFFLELKVPGSAFVRIEQNAPFC